MDLNTTKEKKKNEKIKQTKKKSVKSGLKYC